jgi:hypothetical protein
VSSYAPSVVNAAEAIRRAAAYGSDIDEVVDLLAAERLIADERVALLQLLLADEAALEPHPADLAVCAFVSLGYEEFRRVPEPTVLIDVRSS